MPTTQKSRPEGRLLEDPATFWSQTKISRGTATGIRTRVSAVRGRRPSPLDDSGLVARAWRRVPGIYSTSVEARVVRLGRPRGVRRTPIRRARPTSSERSSRATLRYCLRSRRKSGTPCGCGGIGRRAAFRSPWEQSRGGSSPLIRIRTEGPVTDGAFVVPAPCRVARVVPLPRADVRALVVVRRPAR